MKTLGILMGTKTSFISNEYYNNNFKKFKYLDDLDPKLFKYKDDIPYDYAIYCEIKSVVKNKMNVIPLFGPKLTLKSTIKPSLFKISAILALKFEDGKSTFL